MRRLAVGLVLANFLVLAQPAHSAGGDKELRRIKGVVGFQTSATAAFHQVVGRELLADDAFALTQARSAAELVLQDSSIVAFGENTRVQVGAFDSGAAGPGSTIAIAGGSLRFDIRRPPGGTANYHFNTTTTQVAVRGTVGLISFLNQTTTIVCLSCAADSVAYTVAGQTFALAPGTLVTIGAAGSIVTGTITSSALTAFSSAQVSIMPASGAAAATAGVAGGLTGSALTGAVAGAAAAAGIGAALSVSHPTAPPSAQALPTSAPTQVPSMSPAPSPTATVNVGVQGKTRGLSAPLAPPAVGRGGPR